MHLKQASLLSKEWGSPQILNEAIRRFDLNISFQIKSKKKVG